MIEFEMVENDLRVYDLGRKLNRIVGTEIWDIILDTFADMRDNAQQDLFRLPPGDENVPTAHAAASALTQAYSHFKKGVEDAVAFAGDPSDELKIYLKQALETTDVVRQMEKK